MEILLVSGLFMVYGYYLVNNTILSDADEEADSEEESMLRRLRGWQNPFSTFMNRMSVMKNGLINGMARTSSGKTRIPFLGIEEDIKIRNATRFIVPYAHRHLRNNHTKKLREFLRQNEYKFEIYTLDKYNKNKTLIDGKKTNKKINKHEGNFLIEIIKSADGSKYPFYIQAFCWNRDPTYQYCQDMIKTNEAIYFDEFPVMATQFGLKHAGCMYSHSKSDLNSLKSYVDREKEHSFKSLDYLCKHNKVVTMSATNDDIICNELLPYYGVMNIKNIIVNHRQECFPEIPIIYQSEEDIKNQMIKNLSLNVTGTGTDIVFCPHEEELNEHYNCAYHYLRRQGICEKDRTKWLYKNTSKDNEALDVECIKNSRITFLINKGTTGVDIDSIDNIFIFRKLSDTGSSSRDKPEGIKFLSNLAQQICGRLRNDGTIYWLHENQEINPKEDTTLFQETEKLFREVSHKKNTYVQTIIAKINQHKLDDLVSERFIRTFIFKLVKKGQFEYTYGKKRSILIDSKCLCLQENGEEIHNNINVCIESGDHTLFKIEEYLELEKKLIELYKEIYTQTTGDTSIFDTTNRQRNCRSTGGGNSKSNISKTEEKKGILLLKQAIENLGLGGCDVFIRPKEKYSSDDDYSSDEDCSSDDDYSSDDDTWLYMHAERKEDLDSNQRTKSKYAIPTLSALAQGLNAKEEQYYKKKR